MQNSSLQPYSPGALKHFVYSKGLVKEVVFVLPSFLVSLVNLKKKNENHHPLYVDITI